MRDIVIDFYRGLYGIGARNSGFLCQKNDVFMHPVLTPNFLCRGSVEREALARDRQRFLGDFALSKHWLQLFPDQVDKDLLASEGYQPTMTCAFNVFRSPLVRERQASADIMFVQDIPGNMRHEYEAKTEKNCHNLPAQILHKIETVLKTSNAAVSYILAFKPLDGDCRELVGAVTRVRVGTTTLFINAWVEHGHRGHGMMRLLFSAATTREFAEGQTAAFYWTLNPIIAAKGDLTGQVVIYSN